MFALLSRISSVTQFGLPLLFDLPVWIGCGTKNRFRRIVFHDIPPSGPKNRTLEFSILGE